MSIAVDPQLKLSGENVIDDAEFLHQLEVRESKKAALKSYRKGFRSVDLTVRGKLESMELDPGTYRCGQFVIEVEDRPSRSVEFTTEPKRSIKIRAPKEE